MSSSCRSLRPYSFSERNFLLQPTRMAEFTQIQSIQTLVSDCKEHAKACIKLRVAGAAETLSITCSSLDQAESLADLIDGYCRLVTDSNTSLWNRKGKKKSSSRALLDCARKSLMSFDFFTLQKHHLSCMSHIFNSFITII